MTTLNVIGATLITYNWATPFQHTSVDDEQRIAVVQKIFSEISIDEENGEFHQSILDRDDPVLREFRDKVVIPTFNSFLKETVGKEIGDWRNHKIHGWLAGSGTNYSMPYHNHRNAQLSAVFYLLCDDQRDGGTIYFTDPRQNANRAYDKEFFPWFADLKLTPKSGDAVVFPSFLYHYVTTYQGFMRLAMPVDLFLYN